MGLTIYGEEEAKIKQEVEQFDGLGKPVSFATLDEWCSKNQKSYTRSEDDAYNALMTLTQEGIISEYGKSEVIAIRHLKHLVSEVGDKIKAEEFDKIIQSGEIKNDHVPLEEFMTFLRK